MLSFTYVIKDFLLKNELLINLLKFENKVQLNRSTLTTVKDVFEVLIKNYTNK